MSEYNENERRCQASFESCGPCWHVYTSGKETGQLFTSDEDMMLAMNITAQAAYVFKGKVIIIAFQMTGNHFHYVMTGLESDIRELFGFLTKRLSRALACTNDDTETVLKDTRLNLRKIEDLQSMRNSIVYVNRNGYAASPSHTPFSYPWGTSAYYFSRIPEGMKYSDINTAEARRIFRGRAPELPKDWELIDGYVCPASYCAVNFGMAMFRDAHHYFQAISRNVESFS